MKKDKIIKTIIVIVLALDMVGLYSICEDNSSLHHLPNYTYTSNKKVTQHTVHMIKQIRVLQTAVQKTVQAQKAAVQIQAAVQKTILTQTTVQKAITTTIMITAIHMIPMMTATTPYIWMEIMITTDTNTTANMPTV